MSFRNQLQPQQKMTLDLGALSWHLPFSRTTLWIIVMFVWAYLAYKLYFFSQRIVFFSHTKSANSTFSHSLSAKQAQTNTTHSWLPYLIYDFQSRTYLSSILMRSLSLFITRIYLISISGSDLGNPEDICGRTA